MFRFALVIAIWVFCIGVMIGADSTPKYDNEKNPPTRLSAMLKGWSQTGITESGIELLTSKNTEETIPFQNTDNVMKHKETHHNKLEQHLDYEVIQAKAHEKSNNHIQRQASAKIMGKTFHVPESIFSQDDDVDGIEEFRSKSRTLPQIEESDSSSGPSDGVMIPAILYKLQVFSSALCSEWNHKFAVFKAFVYISCLTVALVAMFTLIVYFIDVKKRQNDYMKLKLLS